MGGKDGMWMWSFKCLICGCRLQGIHIWGADPIIECPECYTEYLVRKDRIELINVGYKLYEDSNKETHNL